ncbi:bola-like protein [Xylaria sp. CBS 124048]|nr:bola-like protein [Xylaria sp. CBS 124048]
MLCFQCRRIAVSVLRQASAAARTNPINRLPSHASAPAAAPARTFQSSASRAVKPPLSGAKPSNFYEKPRYLSEAESAIWDKLKAAFNPTYLVVQDISGGCGSMYGIEIESEAFRNHNMLKQQRMVNAILADEMKTWHGIQLRTKVPSEADRQAHEQEENEPKDEQ